MDIFVGIFMTVVGGLVAIVVCGALLLLYLKNAYKVLQTLQGKTGYSVLTAVRAVGIFIPLLGIVMGLVKGA